MIAYLAVALGGALGSVARYSLSGAVAKYMSAFPLAIMLINISGSFLLALTVGALARYSQQSQTHYLLLAVGFCGGYTTFSTFSLESWQMLSSGKFAAAAVYVLGSVTLSIAGFGAGLWVMR